MAASLARTGKTPFPQLSPDVAETIKGCLIKCNCLGLRNRPAGFYVMRSEELRAWGREHNRLDMITHAGCVKKREDLDKCSDDIDALTRDDEVHPDIRMRAGYMSTYLGAGFWYAGQYPRDGAIRETERICKAWHLSLNGRNRDALALWDGVEYIQL